LKFKNLHDFKDSATWFEIAKDEGSRIFCLKQVCQYQLSYSSSPTMQVCQLRPTPTPEPYWLDGVGGWDR